MPSSGRMIRVAFDKFVHYNSVFFWQKTKKKKPNKNKNKKEVELQHNFKLSPLFCYRKMGKLQSWFLSFISYFNLVPNLSIILISSLTFSVLYKSNLCRYLLNEKKEEEAYVSSDDI